MFLATTSIRLIRCSLGSSEYQLSSLAAHRVPRTCIGLMIRVSTTPPLSDPSWQRGTGERHEQHCRRVSWLQSYAFSQSGPEVSIQLVHFFVGGQGRTCREVRRRAGEEDGVTHGYKDSVDIINWRSCLLVVRHRSMFYVRVADRTTSLSVPSP